MPYLEPRPWTPAASETLVQQYAHETADSSTTEIASSILELVELNRQIHERDCFNLNPAANVMNPRAEALLASGLSTRPSLGYPGDKYEMGLEATEQIEVIAAELSAEVFNSKFAEIRIASGAMANLYGFMATCQPGDSIIAPPDSIGGHVTHHLEGCAGLYGIKTIAAPIHSKSYTVDVDELKRLANETKPALITIGGSLNLIEHPVAAIREIADSVNAKVLFDAAHQCGIIAGKAWKNPLDEGAHLMTMSTYKSLGGPAGGLIVSNDAEIMQRIDNIAFPGMTANFDAAKSAALAVSLLDWREHGGAYASKMISVAAALADSLQSHNHSKIKVFSTPDGITRSHQFALLAEACGGGQTMAKKLRQGGFLTCGIGLPVPAVDNDLNGLRIGTPELVRFGVGEEHTDKLAKLMGDCLDSDTTEDMEKTAREVAEFRSEFNELHYICN